MSGFVIETHTHEEVVSTWCGCTGFDLVRGVGEGGGGWQREASLPN